jgi:hypothetical protein
MAARLSKDFDGEVEELISQKVRVANIRGLVK